MDRPSISVALATFNGERFLQEQLESIVRQTVLPAELVVCDDCSTDDTLHILHSFGKSAPFPVMVAESPANRGPGETFLEAASRCSGQWIAFCDQDDVWMDGKLERISEVLLAVSGVGMVSHSALQVGERLERLPGVPRHPDHRRRTVTPPLRNPPMRSHPGFSCVFRRSLFEALPYDRRPRHKTDAARQEPHDNYVYNITNTYARLVRLPDVLALHRRHGGTVTGAPGTGVKSPSTRQRLASRGEQHRSGLLDRADLARSHRMFYQEVLEDREADRGDEFLRRTGAAVAYYGALETAYTARAAIYDPGARAAGRFRALARCIGIGAYADHAGGRGIGPAALARDLAGAAGAW